MSSERHGNSEAFLNRWSRLKAEARETPVVEPSTPAKADAKEPLPDLPPVEQLTLDSDFSGFFHPKVDEGTRRAALRKLFSDPHFNVMDGLDTYIDDYSTSEPIPAAMMASLKQAQRILDWAADKDDEAQVAPASATPPAIESASTEALPAPEPSASVPPLETHVEPDAAAARKS